MGYHSGARTQFVLQLGFQLLIGPLEQIQHHDVCLRKINLKSGKAERSGENIEGGKIAEITIEDAPCLLWLVKQ